MRILYDGWSICYHPNGPAALHLLAVLAHLPEEIQPIAALPNSPPVWFPEMERLIQPFENKPKARLQWEQRALPKMAADTGAHLLHLMRPNPPLFVSAINVISPSGYDFSHTTLVGGKRESGLFPRLREALGRGGLSRSRAVFWPADLPKPNSLGPILELPPCVHPYFAYKQEKNGGSDLAQELALPETYILYHGPHDSKDLQRLFAAWSWAASSIGTYYPLVILGLDQPALALMAHLTSQYDLEEAVITLTEVDARVIPYLYQGCSALFHPAPASPWGGSIRQAMVCGKPIVAAESPLSSAMVGSGAYLIPVENLRQLGAALITAIVEEEVAASLSSAALKQANSWQGHTFGQELALAYRNLIPGER